MAKEVVVTHAELEREAEIETARRFRALGVERPVRPARLGAGMRGQARAHVNEWLERKGRL
jgi:hypothetical protein